MTPIPSPVRADRLDKILALLDSDQPGEVQAAAHALRRMLSRPAAAPRPAGRAAPSAVPAAPAEAEACLAYATSAVGVLSAEIARLRAENAGLRILLASASARRRPGRTANRSH